MIYFINCIDLFIGFGVWVFFNYLEIVLDA